MVLHCFNPHPAFWPDATPQRHHQHHGQRVSILIRPSGRMQLSLRPSASVAVTVFQSSSGLLAGCNGGLASLAADELRVSILIRPSGRMQQVVKGLWAVIPSFNPHPAFWPDATALDHQLRSSRLVSILIRPSGRMQLKDHLPYEFGDFPFQSSSGLLAGCNGGKLL